MYFVTNNKRVGRRVKKPSVDIFKLLGGQFVQYSKNYSIRQIVFERDENTNNLF